MQTQADEARNYNTPRIKEGYMSVVVDAPPIERYQLSIDRYHQMIEKGIFAEDERIELIEGAIAPMSPIGSEHSGVVDQLAALLIQQLGQRAIVKIQGPMQLGKHSEPQPDLVILTPRHDFYKRALPRPADVLLVIEVADASLTYDRAVKMPLYARAGIPEAWIINLIDRWIEVYRDPAPVGYTTLHKILTGKSFTPQMFTDVTIQVNELLSE
jgi:Uma2 family endonuclease